MRKSMTFNGIKKPWLYLLEGRQKSPFAPIRNNLIRVTGMAGAHVASKETDVMYISQPIGFIVKDDEHALKLKDELASWLITNEAVPLQFDDEPGRTYYAEIEGTIEDFTKFVDQRKGVITFLVADGVSYGPEKNLYFPTDMVSIPNEGTAEADPIFELTAKEKTTFAMVSNQDDEYMMIGKLADDDVEVVDSKEKVLEISSDMSGWNYGGTEIDPISGTISDGTMTFDGTGIIANDYGSQPGSASGYGPAIINELPAAIEDFEIGTVIDTRTNTLDQNFRVEVYGFDENMQMLGKIGISDVNRGLNERRGLARIGEYVDESTRYLIHSDNFRFINSGPALTFLIKWKREARITEFNIYRIVNGELRNWTRRFYTDINGTWLGRLKFIQIYIRSYHGRPNPTLARINSLDVYKLSQATEDQTPYILYPGDVVTLDHKNDDILLNGEPRNDLLNFGASFFKLKRGENLSTVTPEDAFDVSMNYREKFR